MLNLKFLGLKPPTIMLWMQYFNLSTEFSSVRFYSFKLNSREQKKKSKIKAASSFGRDQSYPKKQVKQQHKYTEY